MIPRNPMILSYTAIKFRAMLPGLFIMLLVVIASSGLKSQTREARILTLDQAVNMALSNHPLARNAALQTEAAKIRKQGSILLNPTQLNWEYGQINSPVNDNRLTIAQNFGSPVTHLQRNKLYNMQYDLSLSVEKIQRKKLVASVKEAYFRWLYQLSYIRILEEESELYHECVQILHVHDESGESNRLGKIMAETRYSESQRKLVIAGEQLKIAVNNLNRQIYSEEVFQPSEKELELYSIQFSEGQTDKFYPFTFSVFFEQQIKEKNADVALEKSYLYPEITAGWFNQKIGNFHHLQGVQLGVSVPLWFRPQVARIKEAQIMRDMALNDVTLKNYELEQSIDDLKIRLDQEFINVIYFRESALLQAGMLLETAITKLEKKEINFSEFLQSATEATKIRENYLQAVLQYNLCAVELEYYLN